MSNLTLFDTISSGKPIGSQFGSLLLTSHVFYDIFLEYQNGGSAGYIILQYSSNSESIKTIPSSTLFTQINSNLSPYQFFITPGPTIPGNCLITTGDSNPLTIAYSGSFKLFVIKAYDAYGNLQTGNHTFIGNIQGYSIKVGIIGNAGVYTGNVTFFIVGVYNLNVFLVFNTSLQVSVQNVSITVYPGAAYSANTVINYAPITSVGN